MKLTITKSLGSIFCGVLLALATLPAAFALDITYNNKGSDLAFNPTGSSYVVDLSLARSGNWEDKPESPGQGIYDPEKWAVVFKFSAINIPAGTTVTFKNHPSRAPVVWLVEGSVTIDGKIALDAGGPGGYRGATGRVGAAHGGAGLGPGGAGYRAGRSGSGAGYIQPGTGNAPGLMYGNSMILPLIGGSGGSGEGTGDYGGGYGGGAGGGAILIASDSFISVNGEIRSVGGADTCGICGHGSGGAIRLIGELVVVLGTLNVSGGSGGAAGSSGRLRIEANEASVTTGRFSVEPSYAMPGATPKLWPSEDSPKLTIISVDGQSVITDPLANRDFPKQDVSISNTNLLSIHIQCSNVPTNWNVSLRIAPFRGSESVVNATLVTGNDVTSMWEAQAIIASSVSVLQARAYQP